MCVVVPTEGSTDRFRYPIVDLIPADPPQPETEPEPEGEGDGAGAGS